MTTDMITSPAPPESMAAGAWHSDAGPAPAAPAPRRVVCMVVACPFPAHQGTPGSIREMAEAVAEQGHEVHIVTYHFGQDIPVRGPHVHRITPLTRESAVVIGPTARKPLYDLQLVFETLRVIRRHRPEVLHAHGYEAMLAAWICKRLTGIPVLYSGHNTMGDELASYGFFPKWFADPLAAFLDTVVPRLADRCLPHSENMAAFFRRKKLARRTADVVPFGIDLDAGPGEDPDAIRARYGLGDAPVVLYAGLTDEFQRLDLLLEAMVEVVRREPRAKLLIAISIPHQGQLEALARRAEALGLADRLVVTEPLPAAAVRASILPVADVAVVPRPRTAGFPIKLINYMAARRPCVLFASSAGAGLVDGEHARLVGPETGPALGEAIAEVLRDRALGRQLADNGYRFVVAHHDRRSVARRIGEEYARTLARGGR